MAEKSINTEQELLLQRIIGDDEYAFEQLFDLYQAKVYTVALAITRQETLAEDLVLDVFLKIWLKRKSLLSIDNFEAYLFIITRNEAFHMLQRLAKYQEHLNIAALEMPLSDNTTDHNITARNYANLLQMAIERLPVQQQQVYRLIREEGLTREETAVRLGIKPESVKTHLSRALKNIRAWCISHMDLYSLIILVLSGNKFFLYGNIFLMPVPHPAFYNTL